jgi:prepilin peptidase dependent protein B
MTARYQKMSGFTLIELMISIAIPLIVVLAITSLTVRSLDSANNLARTTRLEQEMRGILQVMTRDLKRAGYRSTDDLADSIGHGSSYDTSFQTFATEDMDGVTRCITYSYDRNDDGSRTTSSPKEVFGFRYADNQVKELKDGSKGCADNDPGDWETVSDDAQLLITDLRFIVTPTVETIADTAGLLGNDATITQRQVLISISGRLSDDSSVVRTLHESVKLRNSEFTPPS